MNTRNTLTTIAIALSMLTPVQAQQGPTLAMVFPQSKTWVALDDQPLTSVQPSHAGSRITAGEDGVAQVGIPDAAGGILTLLGAADEQARMSVGGTDFSQRRIFSLEAGAVLVDGQSATENIKLVALGRTLTLQRTNCLVRVKNGTLLLMVSEGAVEIAMTYGTPPLVVGAGQWLTLDLGSAPATPAVFKWPETLDAFGLGRQGRAVAEGLLGAGRDGTESHGPTLLQLLYIAMFLFQMARVVYPKFGDRAVAAACVAFAVEGAFGLSRHWLKLADVPVPAGGLVIGALVLWWVLSEEHARKGRETGIRTQFVSHVSKCVLIWVLALLVGHGALVFNPRAPQNVVRLPRAQFSVASADTSPIVTAPPQQDLVTWELLSMVLPGLYLMVR